MKITELQNIFISELQNLLPDWKFIKSNRHFKKVHGDITWYFHISCIKHVDDFDATGDVSVEIKSGNKRVCIIGAQLANIEGIGQKRFPVYDQLSASVSSNNICKYVQEVGLPFLERFNNPEEILTVLKNGGKEAVLISPLNHKHQEQIELINKYIENKNM